MENIIPITQRKIITMDYEEYLKLEIKAKAFDKAINDIFVAQSLSDLKQQYNELIRDNKLCLVTSK